MASTKLPWRERLFQRIVREFGHPRGLPGRLVGWVMTWRGSNRRRNRWAVDVLDVQPTDEVLEIGFGPGLALRELSQRASRGHVHGLDHSAEMVRQATRRNQDAVRAGRVRLQQGSIEDGVDLEGPVDKILAVNTVPFWPDPEKRLQELRELLRPGGTIALVRQPRGPGAGAAASENAAEELQALLTEAGFAEIRVERLDLDPPVVCVLGRRS